MDEEPHTQIQQPQRLGLHTVDRAVLWNLGVRVEFLSAEAAHSHAAPERPVLADLGFAPGSKPHIAIVDGALVLTAVQEEKAR